MSTPTPAGATPRTAGPQLKPSIVATLLVVSLQLKRLPAPPYRLVDARHVPGRHQLLTGAPEGGADDGHHPVDDDEAAEDTEHHVSPRPDPADAPQLVDEEDRQPDHDHRRDDDLHQDGGEVEVAVVRVEAGQPVRQGLGPVPRGR